MSKARECGSKIQYRSKHDADWAAFKAKRSRLGAYGYYRCKHCSFWHIGHQHKAGRSGK